MEYEIRFATMFDIEHLPAIEQTASELFKDTEFAAETTRTCLDVDFLLDRQRNRSLWVAISAGYPVGFAVLTEIDGNAHLHELSVHPNHQRKGLGRRLVETVCDHARRIGFSAISLSTYSAVAWNAPFYASLGFRSTETYSRGYESLREEEARSGLDVFKRTIMIRDL